MKVIMEGYQGARLEATVFLTRRLSSQCQRRANMNRLIMWARSFPYPSQLVDAFKLN